MSTYLNLALVIISIALIVIILIQSKGAGLGGLGGGGDMGGSGFHVRRGIERLFFNITIVLSVIFFLLAVLNVVIVG